MTRIYQTQNPILKIVWILTSIVFLAFGILLSYYSFADYLEFNVITNIETILESPFIFPAFTLCGEEAIIANITEASRFKDKPIEAKDLIQFSDFELEKCVRFNGGYDLGKDDELKSVTGTDFLKNSLFIKVPVTSRNQSFRAYLTSNYLNFYANVTPVYLYAGRVYNFYLSKTVDEKMKEPFNDCIEESHTYHVENCIEKCVNDEAATRYGCSLSSYYELFHKLENCDHKYAATRDHNTVLKPIETAYRRELSAYCSTQCPEGCYSTTYQVTFIEDTPPLDDSLHIYVVSQSLRYTRISQIARMTINDLIGAVGGTLGMMVGFQFLSILEIFDFFYHVIIILLAKN